MVSNLSDRLMVGLWTLNPPILVRIQVRQQIYIMKRKSKKSEKTTISQASFFDEPIKTSTHKKEDRKEIIKEKSPLITPEEKIFTVSVFLDALNIILTSERVSIVGEVSECKIGIQWVGFSLKDKEDESKINAFLSRAQYNRIGVPLEDGMEIKMGGYPRIYKPRGQLSFAVERIEPIGEGSLKRAYELLKKQLELEGLFTRKRPLPQFIERIGIITSRDGVVIHDFRNNLDKLNYKLFFRNARVEGEEAVANLVDAIERFNNHMPDLDVLVIIRGGGSLESLQAFNNERVARAIFASKIPTLCGIGHDVNVPIACLVADQSVSTPTAAAYTINNSWESLHSAIPLFEEKLFNTYERELNIIIASITHNTRVLLSAFSRVFLAVEHQKRMLTRARETLSSTFNQFKERTRLSQITLMRLAYEMINKITTRIAHAEAICSANNPLTQLALGYSIVRNEEGKILKSARDIKKDMHIITQLTDGTVASKVEKSIINE